EVFSTEGMFTSSAQKVTDVAGNTSAPANTFAIKIDETAPSLSASITSPAMTGWYNISTGPATVTYVASDSSSGVTTPSPYMFSDGSGQSVTAITVTDVAGNESSSVGGFSGIDQDTVAPSLSAKINSPAGTGWYNSSTGPATVTYTASDATSGV